MSEAKEKDRILAQIQANKPYKEIAGLNKCVDELMSDGNVKCLFAEGGSIIRLTITPQGKRFLENGGYSRLSREHTNTNMRNLIFRILENTAVAIISGWVGWELRGCVQSDNPECTEANCFIDHSTPLSSASWSGLKDDSVASRAKWSGVSLDSAKSTLANDSMRMLEIETSAQHSDVRDESRAVPSGR